MLSQPAFLIFRLTTSQKEPITDDQSLCKMGFASKMTSGALLKPGESYMCISLWVLVLHISWGSDTPFSPHCAGTLTLTKHFARASGSAGRSPSCRCKLNRRKGVWSNTSHLPFPSPVLWDLCQAATLVVGTVHQSAPDLQQVDVNQYW